MTSPPVLLTALAAATLSAPPAGPVAPDVVANPPRLLVVVSIDQFRSDFLTRYRSRFLPARGKDGAPGGFELLMSEGAWFPLAEYDVAHALTGPDHSTLLTGAYPYRTGIVLNKWWDPIKNEKVYCVGDPSYHAISSKPPTYVRGTAPTNLLAPTIGDALKNAGYPTRSVSVAIKDRASILMGGFRADHAIWFDYRGGQWMSSTYYEPTARLPAWAHALNVAMDERRGQPLVFEGQAGGSGRSTTDRDFKFEFQHGQAEIVLLPQGVTMTVDAAIAALEALKLGRGGGPDVLTVGLSPLDILGHEVGYTAQSMEELTVAHDRELARLHAHLERSIPGGLRDVLIVLTGDHGGPPTQAYLQASKLPHGRLSDDDMTVALNAHLLEVLGRPGSGNYYGYGTKLNFYLDPQASETSKHSEAAINEAAAAWLREQDGVLHAFTREDAIAGRFPPARFGEQAAHSYHLGRSGDVVALPAPYRITGVEPVIHMTGYAYDRYVPLAFFGRQFRAGVYATAVEMIDVAPTLAFVTGVVPPAMSEGRVLHEALKPAAP